MLNFVTEAEGRPAAVLLRAILPIDGIPTMRSRRTAWRKSRGVTGSAPWQDGSRHPTADPTQFTDGPAKVCQALAIDHTWNGHNLCHPDSQLYIEIRPSIQGVTTGPRVGLNSVPEPWKSIPWRFRVDREIYAELVSEEELE
jgi:DNA-3-methyladenine glycosylase